MVADGRPEDILTPDVLRRTYGAEMLVMRRGRAVYVVEHLGDASEVTGEEVELALEASVIVEGQSHAHPPGDSE